MNNGLAKSWPLWYSTYNKSKSPRLGARRVAFYFQKRFAPLTFLSSWKQVGKWVAKCKPCQWHRPQRGVLTEKDTTRQELGGGLPTGLTSCSSNKKQGGQTPREDAGRLGVSYRATPEHGVLRRKSSIS